MRDPLEAGAPSRERVRPSTSSQSSGKLWRSSSQSSVRLSRWNYTTVHNIIFLALAMALLARYFRKGGGVAVLPMMNKPIAEHDGHGQPAAAAHSHH